MDFSSLTYEGEKESASLVSHFVEVKKGGNEGEQWWLFEEIRFQGRQTESKRDTRELTRRMIEKNKVLARNQLEELKRKIFSGKRDGSGMKRSSFFLTRQPESRHCFSFHLAIMEKRVHLSSLLQNACS